MIDINNLSFTYENGTKEALHNINLHISSGDFIGIIGESGAGKSTLSYALTGIIPHHYKGDYYGSVTVNGMDTFEYSPSDLAKSIGYVFQDVDSQIISSLVEDEILFALENFGLSKEEITKRISTTLEQVGITDLRYRTISSLSGGQKQKVAIASILALRPDILLLDEPTGELDPVSSRLIFELLRDLNETYHITIIIIEQKIMLLSEYVKKMVVMQDGCIQFFDETATVLSHSDELENLGIHSPRVISLFNELHRYKMATQQVAVNVSQAVAIIRNLCSIDS